MTFFSEQNAPVYLAAFLLLGAVFSTLFFLLDSLFLRNMKTALRLVAVPLFFLLFATAFVLVFVFLFRTELRIYMPLSALLSFWFFDKALRQIKFKRIPSKKKSD